MTRHKRLTASLAAAALAVSLVAAAPAQASTIQLGFILDGSASIGSGNWTTIVNGLADAIQNEIPIGGLDTYEISVVSFGTTTSTIVDRALITSAADATSVAALISGATFLNAGSTNYAAAFTAMQAVLTSSGTFTPGLSYVNFATDGQPNTGGTGVTERNNLIGAGIDNISIEGIGAGVDATFLQNSICYPGPCDTTFPYNFPTQGFYIGVSDATGYANAIGNKIEVVTGQAVPEPTTLLLFGSGLVLARLRRRQRRQS